MISYIARRLLWMVVTLWVVFTVSFFLMRFVPGGPFDSERRVDAQIEQNMKRRYHLDEPLVKQYVRELSNAVRGDLGYPFKLRDYTVNGVVAEGLPISMALGLLALVFALLLGLVAGITSAARRGSFVDWMCMTLATIGIALPNFVIAGVAIMLFVFTIPLFPAAGWGSFDQLILPALCLGAPHAADVARITRTSMLDALSQDYIRTARAKGLSPARVIWTHALPTALIPVVSYLGPAAAYILTGSLVIEQIFAIPGLGSHFIEAALQRDYTLALGCVLVYTFILSLMNLLVDLSYTVLDPRVELK
jgi:oligopeptide transport system permease protein